MTREELFRSQPWYICAQWWFLTALALCYIIPLMFVLFMNPLWFRQSALQWIVNHTEKLARIRDRMLKPQFDKYRLFDILKDVE
jgi:hypothetical protein